MRFRVKAVKADNQLLSLDLDSPDEAGVRAHAELRGCTILAVEPLRLDLRALAGNRSGGRFQVLLFSRELLALLTAGLSLTEAMDTLVEKEQNAASRKLLDGLRGLLYQGKSFSDALQAYPGVFTPFYVATVRASEHTGSLAEALGRFVKYQEQSEMIRKRVVSASIYPALLLAVGGLVSMFLMFYVVPRFSKVYDDMQGEIPFFSRMLLEWGRFVSSNAAVVVGGALVLVVLAVIWLGQPGARIFLMRKIQRIPAIGERVRMYQLSRMYRTMGMLLRGGIPVVVAIDMAKGLLGAELQARLASAGSEVREGVPASSAMERYQLSTPVSSRMLRVGERTGQMGEMMEHTAEFMDEELARWIDWFTRLFEPILMAGIGIVIGLIVVLMYMPIFELASSVQ